MRGARLGLTATLAGLLCLALSGAGNAAPVDRIKITLVPGTDNASTVPAINDFGEIIYSNALGQIVSTTRGVVVGPGFSTRHGLSNSGEVVYASGLLDARVISTLRGQLVNVRSFGPSISPNTGEVVYSADLSNLHDADIVTTLQGTVFSPPLGLVAGLPDVNDLGEVVYQLRDNFQPALGTRIFSSTRGMITPPGEQGIQPAINNAGEVVWSGFVGPHQQIFSSRYGQLTFPTGKNAFLEADLPDIADDGTIVFRGVTVDGVAGLFTLVIPEPSALELFLAGLVGLLSLSRVRLS